MPPGVAPPYRHAAAWPSSWKPADSTTSAVISSSSPGLSNAWAVADATPFSMTTNHSVAAKPARIGTRIQGRKRKVNGRVSRRVASGFDTSAFQRSARSGLTFGGAGLVARALDGPEQLDARRAAEVPRGRAVAPDPRLGGGGRFVDDRHPCRCSRRLLLDVGVLLGGR